MIPRESVVAHDGLVEDVVCSETVSTGIALVPQLVEEMDSSKVVVDLYHEEGTEGRELDIGKHYSGLVTDMFPSLQIPFSGQLVIRHAGRDVDRVYAIALLLEYYSRGWELTSAPVHPWDIPRDVCLGCPPPQ